MTERPIPFNDRMVRAILAGRKTQTRRPMNPQPPADTDYVIANEDGVMALCMSQYGDGEFLPHIDAWRRSPFGIPGDLLYVRECWTPACDDGCCAYYRADYEDGEVPNQWFDGWRPSIHMPKRLARIWLRVERVWAERVQDVSDNDVHAEGFSATCRDGEGLYTATMNFARVWDTIYADRNMGWDDNPWVWACEFEEVDHD